MHRKNKRMQRPPPADINSLRAEAVLYSIVDKSHRIDANLHGIDERTPKQAHRKDSAGMRKAACCCGGGGGLVVTDESEVYSSPVCIGVEKYMFRTQMPSVPKMHSAACDQTEVISFSATKHSSKKMSSTSLSHSPSPDDFLSSMDPFVIDHIVSFLYPIDAAPLRCCCRRMRCRIAPPLLKADDLLKEAASIGSEYLCVAAIRGGAKTLLKAACLAARNGHMSILERVLVMLNASRSSVIRSYSGCVDGLVKDYGKLLKNAAIGGHAEMCTYIITQCAKMRPRARFDVTHMLYGAALGGHVDICRLALAWLTKSPVNLVTVPYAGIDFSLNRMLEGAARGGHLDLCDLAVELGADDINQMLLGAVHGSHEDLIRVAVERGASEAWAAARGAARGGNRGACQLAIQLVGCKPNSILHDAAQGGNVDACILARELGATNLDYMTEMAFMNSRRNYGAYEDRNSSDIFLLAIGWGTTNFNVILNSSRNEYICRLAHCHATIYAMQMLINAARCGNERLAWLAKEWTEACKPSLEGMIVEAAVQGHRRLCWFAKQWAKEAGRPIRFNASSLEAYVSARILYLEEKEAVMSTLETVLDDD